ncbi:MAG TPA: efflux RND transporter periplasmic adaptor subunit [Bryobacteraceae bacterium]|nr:efflux RND transporter periplasmic adaptor subunit [Bryobacteraceae bacterium]
MKPSIVVPALLALAFAIVLAGCSRNMTAKTSRPADSAPPEIDHEQDGILIKVDTPGQFPLVAASTYVAAPALKVTGAVTADVSRNVPVVSMSAGRIVEIRARLGDTVQKGQLLMRVQSSDVADAFSEYRQAVVDEKLAVAQLARSKILYDKGAIAQKDLEVAQQTEEKADVEVETAVERLKVLGADKEHPTSFVDVVAPVDGVITDQQVTAAAGTQGLASPNAFTISDLSRVWVVCDVYEDQLSSIALGEAADIRLNAYPDRVLKGTISNIGAVLDPAIRTAKVRIEVENPGIMRLGMFVEATFHGQGAQLHTVVPASAILHLHDRDWVYVPQDAHTFRRVEVRSGRLIPAGRQEILSGIRPGDRVVANVLLLDSSFEQ